MQKSILIFYLLGVFILAATGNLSAQEEKYRDRQSLKIEFLPFADLHYGLQSNVFKSPETYDTQTGLEKSDSFIHYKAGFDIKGRLTKKNRFKIGYEYEGIRYSSYTVLNEFSNKADVDWGYRFTRRWKLKLSADFKQKDKKATDILGGELQQRYSYNKFLFGPTLIHRILPRAGSFNENWGETKIRLSYKRKNKDYKEPAPPTLSLDYTQDRINLGLIQKAGKNQKVKLGYDHRFRKYKNDLAKTWQGDDNSEGIKRKQNYQTVSVGYEVKFYKKAKFELGYDFKRRIDLYQDYYTYTANIFAAGLEYDLTPTTHFKTKLEYESRKYKIRAAPVVGSNPALTYKYFDFSLGLSQQVLSFLDLYLNYELGHRDTNVEEESLITRRGYRDSIISGGLRLYF